ncbi:lactonase family protein [Aestuariimicrobium soli]|uniref:lactonase family protein n=1 Tax=Aestuariimicrobium soli TaxID=2035834 RepID=UPI003EBB4D5A
MSTLLVGCFTDDSGEGGLHLFEAQGSSLSPVAVATLASPSWLVADGDRVVAIGHTAVSDVTRVTVSDEGITLGAARATAGAIGCHGEISPDRSAIAVAHYESGSVAVVPLSDESSGGWGDATVVRFTGHAGVDPDRQDASHAHQTVWLDDEHLLVCDLGADAVRIIRWRDGHLKQVGAIVTTPGFGPRHLVLRRIETGQGLQTQIAVAGELDGSVVCFRHLSMDWTSGWDRVSQVPGTLVGGSQPSALRALDEHTLVIANRCINTLGILEWHASGQLVLADEFDCGGDHPRDVVVHDGDLWVANQHTGDLCRFTRSDPDDQPCGWRLAERHPVTSASGEGPASMLFR